MRSLGETGFASSWANADAAVRARVVVVPAVTPAIFRNCRRVGCRNVDMTPPSGRKDTRL